MFQLMDANSGFARLIIEEASDLSIVIELSEKYPLNDYQRIRTLAEVLRNNHIELAIDDLGAGYSGLRSWAEIQPDYVKVDRHFIQDIHIDSVKREFLRSIHEISRGLDCEVIAEGIELADELETVQGIGIKYGQGYLLQKPEPEPAIKAPEVLGVYQRKLTLRALNTRPAESVATLLQKMPPSSKDVSAEDVNDLFKRHPQISSLPIVLNGEPVGIISRAQILELFSGRFSHPLFGRKPIEEFMNRSPIVVDHQARLEDVSELITSNMGTDLNTDVVIVKQGQYAGVGKVQELLRLITDYQIRFARYSNPLTLLPGNVPLEGWIDQLLAHNENFRVTYIDINHFKPYNDYFGYCRGDDILRMLGDLLNSVTAPGLDSVGHVGGDDFLIIFRSRDWRARLEKLIDAFDKKKLAYYDKETLRAQGIYSADRRGKKQFFELLSLAIGVAHTNPEQCRSHRDVSQIATDAKHQAKQASGHCIFESRRRGGCAEE